MRIEKLKICAFALIFIGIFAANAGVESSLCAGMTERVDAVAGKKGGSPVDYAEAHFENSDTIVLAVEMDSRLFPAVGKFYSKIVRVFRVAGTFRGEVPVNAVLYFSDQLHESWAPKNVVLEILCEGEGKGFRLLSPNATCGKAFLLFLNSKEIVRSGEKEYVCDLGSIGPVFGNPLPVPSGFYSRSFAQIAKMNFPFAKIREVSDEKSPQAESIQKEFSDADEVFLAAFIEDRLQPNEDCSRWNCTRDFLVLRKLKGEEIPIFSKIEMQLPDRKNAPRIATTKQGSAGVFLSDTHGRGALFYVFLKKGTIQKSKENFYQTTQFMAGTSSWNPISLDSPLHMKFFNDAIEIPREKIVRIERAVDGRRE